MRLYTILILVVLIISFTSVPVIFEEFLNAKALEIKQPSSGAIPPSEPPTTSIRFSNINLQTGWNLVSIPIVPDDLSLPELLNPIEGYYDSVFVYDSDDANIWKSYVPSRPSVLNSLDKIDQTDAFWIKMKSARLLSITGQLTDTNYYYIKKGWNLISYPSQTTQNIADVFRDVEGSVNSISTLENDQWKYYYPSGSPPTSQQMDSTSFQPIGPAGSSSSAAIVTLSTIKPGLGYWVNAKKDDLWKFDGSRYTYPLPDLTISGLSWTPSVPTEDDIVTMHLDIANDGRVKADNAQVKIWYQNIDNQNPKQTWSSIQIPASGFVQKIYSESKALAPGDYEIKVEVDSSNSIQEENEANNQLTSNMRVQPQLNATASASRQSGNVPLKIQFSGLGTGGVSPYLYSWDSGVPNSKLVHNQNVTVIYSTPSQYTAHLLVLDSTERFKFSDNFNIDARPNPTQQPYPDFGIRIDNIALVGSNSINVTLTASNTAPIGSSASSTPVRVTLEVRDKQDSGKYDEIVYDDIMTIGRLTTQNNIDNTFSVTVDNLPPSVYLISAKINPFGAVPEEENYSGNRQNWDNSNSNFDTDEFTITGTGNGPAVIIESIKFDPPEPVAFNPVRVAVNVTNNSPINRALVIDSSYQEHSTNWLGQRTAGNKIPIVADFGIDKILRTGQSQLYVFTWTAPNQYNATVYVDVVDVLRRDFTSNDPIISSSSQNLEIQPYDYAVTDFVVDPEEAKNNLPMTVTAEVHNNSNATGSVEYEFDLDGTTHHSFLTNMEPGDKRRVSYTVEPDDGPFVTSIKLKPTKTRIDMQDIDLSNNSAGVEITVQDVFGCKLKHVVLGNIVAISPPDSMPNPQPHILLNEVITSKPIEVLTSSGNYVQYETTTFYVEPVTWGQNNNVLFTVENTANYDSYYDVSVQDNYLRWNDSQNITKTLLEKRVNLKENKGYGQDYFDDISISWAPEQTGWHNLVISCAGNTITQQVFVQPQFIVEEPDYEIFSSQGQNSHPFDSDSKPRLKMWAKSESGSLSSGKSGIAGQVFQKFRVEDGTNADNVYIIDVNPIAGAAGVVYSHSRGPFADDEYSVWSYMGVDDESGSDAVPCEGMTHASWQMYNSGEGSNTPCIKTLFAAPYFEEEVLEKVMDLGDLLPGKKIERYAGVSFAPLDVLGTFFYVVDYFTCDHQWDIDWYGGEPTRYGSYSYVLDGIRVKNGEEYRTYLHLGISVETDGWAISYVDFFNKEPHKCDGDGSDMPTRGIWLHDIKPFAKAVEFNP